MPPLAHVLSLRSIYYEPLSEAEEQTWQPRDGEHAKALVTLRHGGKRGRAGARLATGPSRRAQ
jgi:hypothetical protein